MSKTTDEAIKEQNKLLEEYRRGLHDGRMEQEAEYKPMITTTQDFAKPAKVKITHTTKGDTWEISFRDADLRHCVEMAQAGFTDIEQYLQEDQQSLDKEDLHDEERS